MCHQAYIERTDHIFNPFAITMHLIKTTPISRSQESTRTQCSLTVFWA